jgi:hypothetical protein
MAKIESTRAAQMLFPKLMGVKDGGPDPDDYRVVAELVKLQPGEWRIISYTPNFRPEEKHTLARIEWTGYRWDLEAEMAPAHQYSCTKSSLEWESLYFGQLVDILIDLFDGRDRAWDDYPGYREDPDAQGRVPGRLYQSVWEDRQEVGREQWIDQLRALSKAGRAGAFLSYIEKSLRQDLDVDPRDRNWFLDLLEVMEEREMLVPDDSYGEDENKESGAVTLGELAGADL